MTAKKRMKATKNPSRYRPRIDATGDAAIPIIDVLRAEVQRTEQRAEAAREDLRRYLLSHGDDGAVKESVYEQRGFFVCYPDDDD